MTDTILIVDDSTFIVEGLVALLKKSYQPIPSYGGEECIEILKKVTPSLIILDIMMEPMDGWETLSRIKDNPKTRHIPVLMFSAKKISPEEAEAHRIIIDDFLTKPVNPKKLLEAIEKVLIRQAFNRSITDTWKAAGVSPEIIEEYLNLKTNLDVDVSLMAVMQKQLDMAHPDASNRQDLMRSIAAIEERIAVSHARIEAFCKERADVLPAPGKRGPSIPATGAEAGTVPEPFESPAGPPAAEPAPGALAAGEEPVAPVGFSISDQAPGAPAPEEVHEAAAVAPKPDQVPDAPVQGEVHDASADTIRLQAEPTDLPHPSEEKIPDPDPLPPQPAEVPVPEKETISPVTDDLHPSIPVIITPPPGPKPAFHRVPETMFPADEEIRPEAHPAPEVTISPPPAGADVDGNPAGDPVSRDSLFKPFAKSAEGVSPLNLPSPAVHQTVSTPRKSMSAGSGTASAAAPGSGTRTPPMRSQGMTSREQTQDLEDERQSRTAASSSRGILSRIFSAIAGIFRRPKP